MKEVFQSEGIITMDKVLQHPLWFWIPFKGCTRGLPQLIFMPTIRERDVLRVAVCCMLYVRSRLKDGSKTKKGLHAFADSARIYSHFLNGISEYQITDSNG
jgi:hypothetical protein